MDSTFSELCGIGILVLCIAFSCTQCDRVEVENKIKLETHEANMKKLKEGHP